MALDFHKLHSTSSWFVIYLLVYVAVLTTQLQISASYPEGNKTNVKYNDFNGSVSAVNGRVFVNYSTSLGAWNSTEHVNVTVYFLYNYTGNGNLSSKVNISVCSASLMKHSKRELWRTESLNGHLLNFCKESQLCGPLNENLTELVKTNWMAESKQFSCELFTACSSFDGTFGIQIVAVTDNRQYIYHIENLSVPSQNMPPTPRNIRLHFNQSSKNQVSLLWDYFHPSQLCGFGVNISTEIIFVIRYYMSNKSNCYFLGERMLNFEERSAKFTNISRMHTKYIFYLFAKSVKNGQTSKPWQKQILVEEEMDKACLVQGGVAQVSLSPEWNCLGKDIVEQAVFCFTDNLTNNFCVPVCEALIFQNGTVGQITSFSGNFISFCREHSEYFHIHSNNTDIVDALWDTSSRKMKCSIFKHCVQYQSTFDIYQDTLDISSRRVLKHNLICSRNLLIDNQPSNPTDVQLISREQYNVTICWKYNKCEATYSNVNFEIFRNGQSNNVIMHPTVWKEEGLRQVYKYTLKYLSPFTNYQIQVKAVNSDNRQSASSTLLNVKTKEGAPAAPSITQIIKQRDGHGIEITWKLPKPEVRYGIINQSIIEVIDVNKTVLNVTLYGENITSAVINITDSQRCDYYRLKICNAPGLCSPYTNTLKYENPCGNGKPIAVRRTSVNKKTMIIAIFLVIILLLVLFLPAILYFRKRRSSYRPRLPTLTTIQESGDTGDYMPIGQTALPNEYHRLNESLSDMSS